MTQDRKTQVYNDGYLKKYFWQEEKMFKLLLFPIIQILQKDIVVFDLLCHSVLSPEKSKAVSNG